jgi:hypothetical protein
VNPELKGIPEEQLERIRRGCVSILRKRGSKLSDLSVRKVKELSAPCTTSYVTTVVRLVKAGELDPTKPWSPQGASVDLIAQIRGAQTYEDLQAVATSVGAAAAEGKISS